jgi:predicted nucleic acid-binding protein
MIVYLDTSSLVKLYVEESESSTVEVLAGDLSEKHALRGYDSIHLASALTLRQELSAPILFSCFDDNLQKASKREGLGQG